MATEIRERIVCPQDLYEDPGRQPEPAATAVVDGNTEGLAYVAALGAWGVNAVGILMNAREACAGLEGPADPAAAPPGHPPDPG